MLLLLDATTKSIEAVSSSGPTDIVFVAAYADSTSSAFTEGSSDGAVSTVDTTVVSAPSTSTRRVIKSINFYNTAASSRTVTLKYNNNGTKRTVAVFTLAAGENWSTDDLAGGGGGISSLTVGTTPITGTNGSILYVNGSVLGEIATTGTGNIVRASSPTLTTPNLGTPSAATLTNATGLPLTTGVTGTLPVGNGGTGATSLTANNVLLGNGTSALQVVAPGTSGNVLTSNGTTWTSAAPTGGGREVLTAARTYYIGSDLGAVTANATTDKIEKTAHGLENGDPVVFNATTAPSGITLGAVYYVINKSTNDFEISTTVGGSKVTWTTNGTTVTCYTGNDSNSGYGTNGRTVALLTVQKFFDKVKQLDKNGYSVTGLLSKGIFLSSTQIDIFTGVGAGRVILDGDSNTTSIIRGTTQRCMMQLDAQTEFELRKVQLDNLTGGTSANSSLFEVVNGAVCYVNGPNFSTYAGTNYRNHIWLRGGIMIPLGNWSVSGGNGGGSSLGNHIICTAGFFSGFGLSSPITVTISDSPVFSQGFVFAIKVGVIEMNTTDATNKITFTGSLGGGVKATAAANGIVDSGGNINNFPGTGTNITTGGQIN